jgi:hypothetical protein
MGLRAMTSWYEHPEVQAAIVGAVTTVVTGVAGFGVLLWRLRVEAQRAIDQNKATEALKLKLKVYEQEVVPTVERTVNAQVALSTFVRLFVVALKNYQTLTSAGVAAARPTERAPDLIKFNTAFEAETVAIVTFTERWFVVDPRFEIFKIAINAALHDTREAWGAYFDGVMRSMPADLPDRVHWNPPDLQLIDAIEAVSNRFIDRLGEVGAYAYDFQAEMQNILVGPLFGNNTVPRRQPIDPRHVVISLENDALLTRYFREDTAWGRATCATEERVRAGLNP